jgi:hypothetical protein
VTLDLKGAGLLEDFSQPSELQRLSAFSASSCLTRLRLRDECTNPLPEDGLQHILPEGRRLPQLRVLHVVSQEDTGTGCISNADLTRVAEACPGLAELSLVNVLRDGEPIRGLLPLAPSLTALNVQGQSWGDAAARVVAQLTALRSLAWERGRVSGLGLQELTALRCLTSLSFRHCHNLLGLPSLACRAGINRAPPPSQHKALILTAADEVSSAVLSVPASFLLASIQQQHQQQVGRCCGQQCIGPQGLIAVCVCLHKYLAKTGALPQGCCVCLHVTTLRCAVLCLQGCLEVPWPEVWRQIEQLFRI